MSWGKLAAGLAVNLLVAMSVQAAAQDAASTPQASPPPQPVWSTTCSGATRSGTPDCAIEQRVYLSQTGQLFGALTLRVPAATRAPVMMIQLPLGLFLPAGVSISVDKEAAEMLDIQTCEASGCYAGAPVSETMLAALKRGNQLTVAFQNMQKKQINMPISLVGFTAAFKAIE